LSKKKKEAGERTYSDSLIQCCVLLRINYILRLRQSTSFMRSLFMLIGRSHFAVPDYSTLCRRRKSLPVETGKQLESGEKLAIGRFDGLKVYGEGEWKVRKHGRSKHRTWRKLHICIDLNTHSS
jgi:hypothetical protein